MAVAAQTMTTAVAAPRVHETPARGQERPAALPALTGLRFFAALWVVLHHTAGGLALPGPVGALIGLGYMGVDLFFVLSGFVLAYSYLTPAGTLRSGRRAYYVGRVARLYPAYLLALAVAALPFAWDLHAAPGGGGGGAPLVTVLSTLSLTQAWFPQTVVAWDGPSWSLSVEAVFYLLLPLVIVPVARCPRRALLPACALLCACTLAAPLAYLWLNPDHLRHAALYAPDAPWLRVLQVNPLLRLPEFALGLVAARLFLVRQLQRPLAPRTCVLAALCCAAALVLCADWPYPLLRCGALNGAFALLIYALAAGRGPLARLLATPRLLVLGEASYALYLLHYPLAQLLARGLGAGPQFWRIASPLYQAVYLGLALAASVLCLRLVEQPGRRLLCAWLAPRPPACPALAGRRVRRPIP